MVSTGDVVIMAGLPGSGIAMVDAAAASCAQAGYRVMLDGETGWWY